MTFFSRLFGKRAEATHSSSPATWEAAPPVTKDLFTEDRHPTELEGRQAAPADAKPETVIGRLLERDYEEMGYRDGFRMHDLARMELQLEVIAADFRQAYDMELQEIEVQMGALEKYLVEKTKKEAPDLHEKMRTHHDQLAKKKRELMLQKDLAVTGEGFVERPVKRYKAGFRAGFDLYVEEQLMFSYKKIL